jgi:hypothetical protein
MSTQASGFNVVAFTVIDIDVVKTVGVDDGETLRCGVRISAVKPRCMT